MALVAEKDSNTQFQRGRFGGNYLHDFHPLYLCCENVKTRAVVAKPIIPHSIIPIMHPVHEHYVQNYKQINYKQAVFMKLFVDHETDIEQYSTLYW